MLAVGLTGGIGSGKSAVADLLVAHGAVLIDADQVARDVVAPGGPAYQPLIDRFGPGIVAQDGTIDRPALAAVAFADDAARSDLNAITHPAIGIAMLQARDALADTDRVVVLAIPLLKPAHRDSVKLHKVVVVDCPTDIALERLVSERGMERADAEARIRAQISREERVKDADYVLDNSGDRAALESEVARLWAWLSRESNAEQVRPERDVRRAFDPNPRMLVALDVERGDRVVVATGRRRFLKAAGLLSAVAVLGATFGLPVAVGASSTGGPARVIDTNRIIGTPLHLVASRNVQASRNGAPRITLQPVNQSVPAGSTATFDRGGVGDTHPRVQWRESTNGGGSFTAITGATSTTYSFTATSSENGYEFRAVFTNSAGSATTKAATLTVTTAPSAPVITQSPSSESVGAGSTATFSAAASGSPTPTVQWMESTDSGSTWSNAPGASTSTTYSFTTTSSENGFEYEAVFKNASGTATTNPATLTVTAAPAQSTNWSGYADTGATFTSVSGSWTVPTVTCSGPASSYSAQWIGIDGYSSSTVEQDGTEADCLSGSPSYDAWYEMYGDNAVNNGYEVELSPGSYPVSPGDSMSATVSVSGTTWTLAIADSTHGWTFSTPVTFSAARASAEWVVERPEICSPCTLASLADFGSVTFSNASVSTSTGASGGINLTSDKEIEMVSSNGSTVLALPSSLSTGGTGFSDTWEASS